MKLLAEDGRVFVAEPDGSYVPGPGHDDRDDLGKCPTCHELWPCRSADRVGVWYEDEDFPHDAVQLHRLVEVAQ